jgi:hypothetical protein
MKNEPLVRQKHIKKKNILKQRRIGGDRLTRKDNTTFLLLEIRPLWLPSDFDYNINFLFIKKNERIRYM